MENPTRLDSVDTSECLHWNGQLPCELFYWKEKYVVENDENDCMHECIYGEGEQYFLSGLSSGLLFGVAMRARLEQHW